jgi:hypothetical protein
MRDKLIIIEVILENYEFINKIKYKEKCNSL